MSSQPRLFRRALVLVAATASVALVSGPVTAGASAGDLKQLAVGATGSITFTFVGRIEQDGPVLINVGYLTSVQGMDTADLFTVDDPLNRSAESARFTYFTAGLLEERSVVENLFTTSGSADTTFHYRPDGGASLDDPSSFRDGDEIAVMASTWHNLINVQSPNVGILTAESDELQASATPFDAGDGSFVLGAEGNRFRLTFTGHGVRTDADAPRATVDYSGQAIEVADDVVADAPVDDVAQGGTAEDDVAAAAADPAASEGSAAATSEDGDPPVALYVAILALVVGGIGLGLGLRRRPAA